MWLLSVLSQRQKNQLLEELTEKNDGLLTSDV